jgi:hypothetical protein
VSAGTQDFARRVFLALSAETPALFLSSTEIARLWNATQNERWDVAGVTLHLKSEIDAGRLAGLKHVRTAKANGFWIDLVGLSRGIVLEELVLNLKRGKGQ